MPAVPLFESSEQRVQSSEQRVQSSEQRVQSSEQRVKAANNISFNCPLVAPQCVQAYQ